MKHATKAALAGTVILVVSVLSLRLLRDKDRALREFRTRAQLQVPNWTPPQEAADSLHFTQLESNASYQLLSTNFLKRIPAEAKPFSKMEGSELGLLRGFRYGIREYPDPFWIGRGSASGDINGDGWQDLAFGSDRGPVVYINRGGWFQMLETPDRLKPLRVYAVAFVDLDNDGALDLFFSTFNQGNFVALNRKGQLDLEQPMSVPNNNAVLTVNPGFGDFNNDGFLDILNGNMALGVITAMQTYKDRRQDSITMNKGLKFTEAMIPAYSGETMSSHITDLNHDGHLDILLAHDFVVPDDILLGQADGGFHKVVASDHFIAATPIYSMGIDSGDVNNDLLIDFVTTGTLEVSQETGRGMIDGMSPMQYMAPKWNASICAGIHDAIVRDNCFHTRSKDHMRFFNQTKNLSIETCYELDSVVDTEGCLLSLTWLLVTDPSSFKSCDTLRRDATAFEVCGLLANKGRTLSSADFPNSLEQRDHPFLYLAQKNGSFIDINQLMPGAYKHPGGWTWATRIVDLDDDGWQDLFNSEGVIRQNDYGFNVFLWNDHGRGFVPRQFSFNLTNDFGLYSYTLVDFNHDGHLDIVGNSAEGPIQVYINNSQNNTVAIRLEDLQGNYFGVGARVTIASKEGSQIREVKASGGYQSIDAPVVYFGLGKAEEINRISVEWRDGRQTQIERSLPANKLYLIRRQK